MNLIQNYLTESGCYKAGKHIIVQGLMIHSVGCPQPKADVLIDVYRVQIISRRTLLWETNKEEENIGGM